MRIWNRALKRHVDYPDEAYRADLKRVLYYDRATGLWRWRRNYKRHKRGERADRTGSDGYRVVYYGGKRFQSHNLAYFYVTGKWPANFIDHRDLNRSNNLWKNLRPATRSQNAANCKLRKNNSSGLKGVYWNKKKGCWTSSIKNSGTKRILQNSACCAAAHFAYLIAANIQHGEFARAR